jgi:hypothetical protein
MRLSLTRTSPGNGSEPLPSKMLVFLKRIITVRS